MKLLHKTLEAKATTTDLGEFTALAAAYSVDRTNERILPGAFKGTIERWQESGKQIPVHWDHMGDAKNVIGAVDPAFMRETDDGLVVKGQLDLDESEIAREAWRSMKKNRIGLSFGYLVTAHGKAKDGVLELKALDLFEVSITPAPVNPDTRFIDMKSGSAVWEKWAEEHIVKQPEEQEVKSTLPPATNTVTAGNTHSTINVTGDPTGILAPANTGGTWTATTTGGVLPESGKADLPDGNDEASDEPQGQARPSDPLRKRADELAFQIETRGLDLSAQKAEPPPKREPLPLKELRRRCREAELTTLIGRQDQ
jgi:HK97 family phage prohead protease